jgi:hypothetical protein
MKKIMNTGVKKQAAMKKIMIVGFCCLYLLGLSLTACSKHASTPATQPPPVDTGLVNFAHLDHLYVPVSFPGGVPAGGVYIYSQYPNYTPVDASGEGYTCVDDVSRAALAYLRGGKIASDTAARAKLYNLLAFVVAMQSSNGYFYNFLTTAGTINMFGATSINTPDWWSWRALQTLTEAGPVIKTSNPVLFALTDAAVRKLVAQLKIDFVPLPKTTTVVDGIVVPTWLPAGSGADQSSVLMQGLINYCKASPDTAIASFIRKLADGIASMQQGSVTGFPYDAFLSWSNTWHAYGNVQAYALMQAGIFLQDTVYTDRAMAEVDNYYPWLLQNGLLVTYSVASSAGVLFDQGSTSYDQIAYGIEPMVFAAAGAYATTGQAKYADIAGHLAAWLLGANAGGVVMYNVTTGVCYDGLSAGGNANQNSGAESTIEALLTLEEVEAYPAIRTALEKYKK